MNVYYSLLLVTFICNACDVSPSDKSSKRTYTNDSQSNISIADFNVSTCNASAVNFEQLGKPCIETVNCIEKRGVYFCGAEGDVECVSHTEIEKKTEEICDGIDNDCNGIVDDIMSPLLAMPCANEVSASCSYSRWICDPTQDMNHAQVSEEDEALYFNLSCELTHPIPSELCGDEVDNDCDGIIDEGFERKGNSCIYILESCTSYGVYQCSDNLLDLQCIPTTSIMIEEESACDEIDNDCDGMIDEVWPIDSECELTPSCHLPGVKRCQDGQAVCRKPAYLENTVEACNFIDDDCDGSIDENAYCGHLITNHCALWLGWNDLDQLDEGMPLATWGLCPGDPEDFSISQNELTLGCTSTGGDQEFHYITLQGVVDANDWFGIRWSCLPQTELSEGENHVLQWANEHCRVALAYSDGNGDLTRLDPRNDCLNYSTAETGAHCIKTDTGLFSMIKLARLFDDMSELGIAFWCDESESFPNSDIVKEILMNEVKAYLVLYDVRVHDCEDHFMISDELEWNACLNSGYDNGGLTRCTSSQENLVFRGISNRTVLRSCDQVGAALRTVDSL